MRQGGSNRTRLGRWTQITSVALGLALAALGCGGTTLRAATGTAKWTPTTSAVTSITTSTTAPTTTVPSPTTTTTAAASTLPPAAVIIPAPAGFTLSHRAIAHNGPLTAAGFNQLMNSSTEAIDDHFVDGYHAIYDSIAGPDTIEVIVADFATTDDAQSFQSGFVPSDTTTAADDPAIAGADDFNSTKANPDGSFDHGVIATKGKRVMVIDYYTGSASAVPAVATLAQRQYGQL
jgi:hypothetical protein